MPRKIGSALPWPLSHMPTAKATIIDPVTRKLTVWVQPSPPRASELTGSRIAS